MCIIYMKYIFIILITLCLFSCNNDLKVEKNSLSIITYNLYNLFDDIDDGYEHSSFRPHSGYTARDFQKRVELYSNLFKSEEFEADIIFLQEVESERVLEALLNDSLRRRGYAYYGLARVDNIPTTVGFISKIKPNEVQIHDSGSSRPFMSLTLFKNGSLYRIFSLHAKSNLGDEEENKKERRLMARHLKGLINKDENVIILGDFNTVISNDDLLSFSDSVDSIFVCNDINNINDNAFYDATEDSYYPLNSEGTYNYNGSWYFYDKILISNNIVDTKKYSFRVLNLPSVSKDGFPLAYDNSSESGYSDHFALKLTLGD